MCKDCDLKHHKKSWVHIADDWTTQEIGQMLEYLDYLREKRSEHPSD